jgi:ATP-dependent DNA helicase RecQ
MTTTKIDTARRLSIAEAAARLKARAKPQTSAPLSSTAMPKDPDSILREVFCLPSFKGRQKEVIDAILAGKDAFYVCPTGEGKSLCYQIPAVAKAPDLTVVVSPLKALMNDQVEKLTACGVAVATYHSDMSETDRVATLRRVRSGEITVLLVSPERLSTEEMLSTITSRKVGLVTIDEAHCVSLWGHDFRISYLNLGNAIERISKSQGRECLLI